jgi:ribosomal protein S7
LQYWINKKLDKSHHINYSTSISLNTNKNNITIDMTLLNDIKIGNTNDLLQFISSKFPNQTIVEFEAIDGGFKETILDKTFFLVSRATGLSMHTCMLKLFSSLNSFVEVKKVRIGRRSLLVPFSINLKRRSYLAVKWLMQVIKEDKKRIELSSRLAEEILSVLKNNNSKAKKLRNLNISQALANRSNIHYRW